MRKPVETLSGDPNLELSEFDAPPDEPLPLLESWLKGADARGVDLQQSLFSADYLRHEPIHRRVEKGRAGTVHRLRH